MEAMEALAGFDNSYHASDELVLINTDNAPQTPSGTQSLHWAQHRPGTPPITGARFSGSRLADSNVTERRQQAEA
jgi:hypothetical protein